MAESIEEQAKIRMARLLVATPETVAAELKTAAQIEGHFLRAENKEIEAMLLNRGEPIIDLALACFGSAREIVQELYARARGERYPDPIFRKGIIMGCLSNVPVYRDILWHRSIFSDDEVNRMLATGDDDELYVFLSNKKINAKILKAIYERTAPVDTLPEERWLQLVSYTQKNPRLNIEEIHDDGPDMDHYGIHKALFRLLEIAPTEKHWVHTIHWILLTLDPHGVARPEAARFEQALERWKGIEIKNHKDEIQEGSATSLPFAEEFRCLIAALYGSDEDLRIKDHIVSPNSEDVAYRCAYYGNASMTPSEIKAASEKDKDVFAFFVLLNDTVLRGMKTRPLIEELGWSGRDFTYYYRRRCAQIHSRREWFDPRPVSDWISQDDEAAKPDEKMKALAAEVQKLKQLMTKHTNWILFGVIALGVFLQWRMGR